MKLKCPKCKVVIPASQLNVGTDMAVCERCNEAFSLSGLAASGHVSDGFDMLEPPRGCWIVDTGAGWQIGATTRSAGAFFLVPFMCVWSGGSLGAIYVIQIVTGEFDILLSLFGIPFLLGSLLLGAMTMMAICGKVVVTLEAEAGRVFEGVGSLGRTRRFDWGAVTRVDEDYIAGAHNSARPVIALAGPTRLKFGGMLSEARRNYLIQSLRKLLGERGSAVAS